MIDFFFGKHRFPQNKQNNNEFLQILEVLGSLSTISTIVIVPVFFFGFLAPILEICAEEKKKKEKKHGRRPRGRTQTRWTLIGYCGLRRLLASKTPSVRNEQSLESDPISIESDRISFARFD